MSSGPPLVFAAKDGLGNRLRSLVGFRALAELIQVPMWLYWGRNGACDADFTELFETTGWEDVRLIDAKEADACKASDPDRYHYSSVWFTEIWKQHAQALSTREHFIRSAVRHLHSLTPRRELQDCVDTFSQSKDLAHCTGMHIRMTDNVHAYDWWIKNDPDFVPAKISRLEGFKTEIAHLTAAGRRAFVCTDNEAVAEELRREYPTLIMYRKAFDDQGFLQHARTHYGAPGLFSRVGERIRSTLGIQVPTTWRTTTVTDALVEMLLLARCQRVISTYYSSFGQVSALMGGIPLDRMEGMEAVANEFVREIEEVSECGKQSPLSGDNRSSSSGLTEDTAQKRGMSVAKSGKLGEAVNLHRADGIGQIRSRVMVVSPYAHGGGHYSVFARDLSVGFAMNGVAVTLLHPQAMEENPDFFGVTVARICLSETLSDLPSWLRKLWSSLQPPEQCMLWLIMKVPAADWDLVYWTDLAPGNQRKLWPLSLARMAGMYRHHTAFSEHHPFQWRSPVSSMLHRLLPLDRLRLGNFNMFVHSETLLEQIRKVMRSDKSGRYIPWGLWPLPASDADRQLARQQLGIPATARMLLVFGWQAVYRKNLDALARVARQFEAMTNLTLLFVGKHKDSEPHPFKDAVFNADVRFDEGFISEEKVGQYFAACDGVWANYRSFQGASGVLLQAVSYGRLAICQATGEIGSLCRQHDLGLIVASEGEQDLKDILDRFISLSPDEQERYEENASATESGFSWQRITQSILEEVQHARGN